MTVRLVIAESIVLNTNILLVLETLFTNYHIHRTKLFEFNDFNEYCGYSIRDYLIALQVRSDSQGYNLVICIC